MIVVQAILVVLVTSCHAIVDPENEDVMLDRMMNHHREKRVLCNTVTSTNRLVMANNLGLAFGRRQLINCTQPTGGRFADSCDYKATNSFNRITSSGSFNRLTNNGGFNHNMILGKRDQSQFIGKPKRDIVFLIDDSGSIPKNQFTVAKRGAVNLFTSFCPEKLGKSDKQIAVVLFSSRARTVVSFEDSHQGADWLATKINGLPQASGSTATADALRHVREKVLTSSGARLSDPDTSTHVIVVTDGMCNQGCQNLKEEAKKLRETGPGVQLFAMGVSKARACELDIITGNGADLAFGVSDFNSFEDFAKAMKEVARDEFNGCI